MFFTVLFLTRNIHRESETDGYRSIEILLRPMEVPGHIKSVFIQNAVKLFARLSTACLEKEDDRGLVRVSAYQIEITENS